MASKRHWITVGEMLNRIMATNGLASDYALAKYLETRVQVISNYRNSKTLPDELMAKRIAEELGLPWGYVLTCIAAERAERSENLALANTWRDMAEKMGVKLATVLVAIIAGTGSMAPPPAQAAPLERSVYYVKSPRRRNPLPATLASFAAALATFTGIKLSLPA